MANMPGFLETTRGAVAALLRRGPRTVDELAAELGLTDNAVRGHLATLERDGLVRQAGVRRGPGAGKPAQVYDLRPDAELLFSRAYPPMLATLLGVIHDQLPRRGSEALLRETGRRLGAACGGRASGSLAERARAAARVLGRLGGDVSVSREGRGYRLQSAGCPLGAAVASQPACCLAVESLVAEITGEEVREQCDRGERPRCAFLVGAA